MSVIGIDFGNDTCIIGMAARGGIDIILNENSNRKNPTLVRHTDPFGKRSTLNSFFRVQPLRVDWDWPFFPLPPQI